MDTQPAHHFVKQWPVRAVSPKAAQTASADPMPSSPSPIRGARVPVGVLCLLLPTLLLLLGAAYWLSALWTHDLIQREAEATAAIVQLELQRIPLARILDSKQRERTDWRWQEEMTRFAESLPRMTPVTLWDSTGKVLWSQDRRRNDSQPASAEVRLSLSGKVGAQMIEDSLLPASSAPGGSAAVLEVFVPVRGQDKSKVLGVIGLSQRNDTLEAGIADGQLFIWGIAAGGGLLLALVVVLAVITTSRRYTAHVRSLRAQLSQRTKTVESTNRRSRNSLRGWPRQRASWLLA